MIDLSIEITTYNRKEVLRDLLQRLAGQTHPVDRFEVILSDDGSTDGLLEMVDAMIPRLPFNVRLLRHKHSGPGHAHNCGIRACQAELVLMLAADILPTPMLVAEHIRSHRENPASTVIVSGRLTQSNMLPDTVVQQAANVEVEKIFLSQSDQVEHGGFLISNLSFKKSFMLECGMFHEWPPASGEDIELGYRLKKSGMKVIENELALGFHHHMETLASIAKRAYMTGYNSHHFSAEVDEAWVRSRFGSPEPGSGAVKRVKAATRVLLRTLLINRFTASYLMIPAVRAAETNRFLIPATPILIKKISAFYFKQGLTDFRASRPYTAPDIDS
ncbi:MAG: glycosyltransferase [Chromatiaceae bacterium]|nr:glycosyltransferase [Gammaproteobacteria bacterium]MCB1880449.1 glycosyltransferase [Gammaproteobacteria bacterium]MCP5427186.1 glycosyltransferase [Chromatiaceae bacterium]MCP5446982.1 glycosyltransferase [Chromatiaceae bacterium]